ncbi:MAG: Wzz/FepE/Etk N-terminal domain-containing protein [Candidatus Cohnella colombiensis]|uniref:Wzz/FepE/Etk N-terminal domain-containing protein n=1 Tax=Candidatus Cohnella colombiensis TaxID=3121368 RepID=A0AA95J9U0_9BACL|nr:MAG: Wzz/FepE/Etk N-terminal domain-containing protein [Cohnella sp.]
MKELDLHQYIRIIRKKSLFILLLTAIVTGATLATNVYYFHPQYSNSVTLLVNDRNKQGSSLRVDDILLYEKLMGTYKDIIVSRRILSTVIDAHPSELSLNKLRSMMTVIISTSSQVITIRVADPDYSLATRFANEIAESFQSKLGSLMDVNNVQILDYAVEVPNPTPMSPRVKFNIALAFLISILLFSSAAVIIAYFDTRIRTEEDLFSTTKLPLLGTIPLTDSMSNKKQAKREDKDD